MMYFTLHVCTSPMAHCLIISPDLLWNVTIFILCYKKYLCFMLVLYLNLKDLSGEGLLELEHMFKEDCYVKATSICD